MRTFATWNEANHCGEPTCHQAALVAATTTRSAAKCPSCKILAAELLDMPNMTSWVKEFRARPRVEPKYWGLHNYLDANRLRDVGTRRMLKATAGQIWFTETGGHRRAPQPQHDRRLHGVDEARGDRHALGVRPPRAAQRPDPARLPLSVELSSGRDTWDSALVNSHGQGAPGAGGGQARRRA